MNATARTAALACLAVAAACSEPPDESPLGREFASLVAKPEVTAPQVKVQHVLIGFVGAKRGSESKRNYAEAKALAEDLLRRARAGEDFEAMMKKYDDPEERVVYTLRPGNPEGFAAHFAAVAWHLQKGEFGVAPFHATKSPFGFHLIQRVE